MDANENDIPPAAGFRVQGFPTIKFKAAGSSQFVDYEGDRSLESFLEYIETNSVNKAKPNAAPKASTPVAAGDRHDELCKSGTVTHLASFLLLTLYSSQKCMDMLWLIYRLQVSLRLLAKINSFDSAHIPY